MEIENKFCIIQNPENKEFHIHRFCTYDHIESGQEIQLYNSLNDIPVDNVPELPLNTSVEEGTIYSILGMVCIVKESHDVILEPELIKFEFADN